MANAEYTDEISAIIDEELEQPNAARRATSPETPRIKGELLLLQDDPDPALATEYFRRSLDRARAQGLKRAKQLLEGLNAAPGQQADAARARARVHCRVPDDA